MVSNSLSSGFLKTLEFSVALLFALLLAMPLAASAAGAQMPAALTGVYNGTYSCAQGSTNLKLSVMVGASGDISAFFTFYLPPGTQQRGYTYSLSGQYNPQTAKLVLTPQRWETESPANFGMVGLNGTFDSDEISGAINAPNCRTFHVERDKAESSNIVAVLIAQKNGGKPLGTPTTSAPAVTARSNAPATPSTAPQNEVATSPKTAPARRPAPPVSQPAASQPAASQPPAAQSKEDPYMAALRAQAPASARAALGAPPAASASTPQAKAAPVQPSQAATAPASGAKAAAGASVPNGSQAKGGPSSTKQLTAQQMADIKKAADALADDDLENPVLKWSMSQMKDPRVGGSSLHPVALRDLDDDDNSIDAAVSCNQNGMSVFLETDSFSLNGKVPAFVWYQDAVEKSWVSQVRVTVDGRSHVAKGFPDTDRDQLYDNSLGLFFYKPDLAKQEAREEEFEARAAYGFGYGGTDVLIRPMASGIEDDLNDAAASSGGPITDLLNAKSIRIDFSIQGWKDPTYVDLNPQDPTLHKFVADCAAHLGVGTQPAKPAPAAAPAAPAAKGAPSRRQSR